MRVTLPEPTSDTTGGVVSGIAVTITLRVTTLLIFPATSTLIYESIYVPSTAVLTDPDDWNDPVAQYEL